MLNPNGNSGNLINDIAELQAGSTIKDRTITIDARGRKFRNINFVRVTFKNCKLEGVIFEDCIFEDTTFDDTDLAGAKFIKCNFANSSFRDSDASSLEFDNCILDNFGGSDIDFSGAKIVDSKINNAAFDGADFSEAKFVNVEFDNCEFSDADFSRIKADNLSINNSTLNRIDFSESILVGAKILYCTIERGNFTKADLRKAILDGSNLFGAYFKDALVEDISLYKANITASELKLAADVDKLKIVIQEKRGEYLRASKVYTILRDYFDRENDTAMRNYFHYRQYLMELKSKETPIIRKLKLWVNYISSGFGVKPLRLIFVMLIMVILFGFAYSLMGLEIYSALDASVRSFFGLGGLSTVDPHIMPLITLESIVGSIIISLLVALIAKFNSMEI